MEFGRLAFAGGRKLRQLVDPGGQEPPSVPTTPFQPGKQVIWAEGTQFMQGPDQARRGQSLIPDATNWALCSQIPARVTCTHTSSIDRLIERN